MSSLAAGDQSARSSGQRAVLDHRMSVYDNVPDSVQLSESEGGSDTERMGEESEVGWTNHSQRQLKGQFGLSEAGSVDL